MPNGKPGDHPITDFVLHGAHPFPKDMEEMLLKLKAVDPYLVNIISSQDAFDWEAGKKLDEGRQKLKALLAQHKLI